LPEEVLHNALKRDAYNLEEGRSTTCIKRENLNLKMEVSTYGGLRMTTNSGMLNTILGTLPKLARS